MTMADFGTAYAIVKKWEGNHVYAILKGDDGGETYGGIARNYVPEWSGWPIIDAIKKNGAIKNGTHLPQLDDAVIDYYQEYIWKKKGHCDQIKDQQLANLVFDSCVQHGKAARIINWAVKDTGGKVKMVVKTIKGKDQLLPVNEITNDTLNWLNSVPKIVYPAIWKRRYDYYHADDDFDKFGKGWMNRLNSFPKSI